MLPLFPPLKAFTNYQARCCERSYKKQNCPQVDIETPWHFRRFGCNDFSRCSHGGDLGGTIVARVAA